MDIRRATDLYSGAAEAKRPTVLNKNWGGCYGRRDLGAGSGTVEAILKPDSSLPTSMVEAVLDTRYPPTDLGLLPFTQKPAFFVI